MQSIQGKQHFQRGGSLIGNLMVLAIFAFGVYAAIQYIPQRIEAGAIRSILEQVEQKHRESPIRNDRDLHSQIDKLLSLNEMRDMKENFHTAWNGNTATVTVDYERQLNLLFMEKPMRYHEEVVLN